jgi:ankyrin repeat protein
MSGDFKSPEGEANNGGVPVVSRSDLSQDQQESVDRFTRFLTNNSSNLQLMTTMLSLIEHPDAPNDELLKMLEGLRSNGGSPIVDRSAGGGFTDSVTNSSTLENIEIAAQFTGLPAGFTSVANSSEDESTKASLTGTFTDLTKQEHVITSGFDTFEDGSILNDGISFAASIVGDVDITSLYTLANFLKNKLKKAPNNGALQNQVIPIAAGLVTGLSSPNDANIRRRERQKQNFDDLTVQNRSRDDNLLALFRDAIDSNQNYKLNPKQIARIKETLGDERVDFLVKRYELKKDALTLDDLRMLMIGILSHSDTKWFNNRFIENLLIYCGITDDQKDLGVEHQQIQQLRKEINIDPRVWERIKKTTRDGTFNEVVRHIKRVIPKRWDSVVPARFKANDDFKQDLEVALTITNIEAWQNKGDLKKQIFAANEYLFKKLARFDWKDGDSIQILEADGKKCFYTVKNLINESGCHGFVLVPKDPKESLDLKIVFKGYSLGKEMIDMEKDTPHRKFIQHKQTIFSNLNDIIADFKATVPSDKQEAVSINVGGQGTGGALAQMLINELATYQAANASAALSNDEFQKKLQENIEAQIQYELENGKKSKKLLTADPRQYVSRIQQLATDYFRQTKADLDKIPNNQLASIKKFTVTTTNSAGIKTETRNNFIQALAILEQLAPITIECYKTMVGGDAVQQTGVTDLGAYMPHKLMPTTLLKINSGLEGAYKEHLAKIAMSASLIVVAATLASVSHGAVIPIMHVLPINPIAQANIINDHVRKLLSNAIAAHRDCYGDQIDFVNYQLMSNAPDDDSRATLNKELSIKITEFTNRFYRTLKKTAYGMSEVIEKKSLGLTQDQQSVPAIASFPNPMNLAFSDDSSIFQSVSSQELVLGALQLDGETEEYGETEEVIIKEDQEAMQDLTRELMSMLEAGHEVVATNGEKFLHDFAETGDLDAVKNFLYINGEINVDVDVNAKNNNGETALHIAAKNDRREVVDALLGLMTEETINIKNKDGKTALYLAVESESTGTVEEFFRSSTRRGNININVDASSPPDHRSILRVAVGTGNVEIFNLLLKHGAVLENINDLLQTAVENEHVEIVGELVEYVIGLNKPIMFGGWRQKNVEEENARINCLTKVLHFAAKKGRVDIIKNLLEKGVQVDAKDANNKTALHFAAEAGEPEVVAMLLEHKAKLDVKDKNGQTPLHLAVINAPARNSINEEDEKRYVQVINNLTARGVDPTIRKIARTSFNQTVRDMFPESVLSSVEKSWPTQKTTTSNPLKLDTSSDLTLNGVMEPMPQKLQRPEPKRKK